MCLEIVLLDLLKALLAQYCRPQKEEPQKVNLLLSVPHSFIAKQANPVALGRSGNLETIGIKPNIGCKQTRLCYSLCRVGSCQDLEICVFQGVAFQRLESREQRCVY